MTWQNEPPIGGEAPEGACSAFGSERITIRLSTYCKDGAIVSVAEAEGHGVESRRGSVIGDLARLLLAEGADPAADLHVLDRDTGAPRLMPERLGRWARTTIEEGDGLRVRRWRPLPDRAGGPKNRQLAPAAMGGRRDG